MTLHNWGPHKGSPQAWEVQRRYELKGIQRQDLDPVQPGQEAQLIEETFQAEGYAVPAVADVDWDAPFEERQPRRRAGSKGLPALVGQWSTWYQVTDVATLSVGQAHELLHVWPRGERSDWTRWSDYAPRELTVEIDYPLRVPVRLTVPLLEIKTAGRRGARMLHRVMSPGYLLWVCAQEYRRIYQNYDRYGVWGHALSDLGFEGIGVSRKGSARLLMGS